MNPPSLAPILSDRRVWLMLLAAALAISVGFFAIPDSIALVAFSHSAYWLVLVAFVLFVRALWQTFRDDLRALSWRGIDWASVVVVALGGTVLLVHETFGFKIIMDEIMLLGTSMSLHFDKLAITPTRGNDIQGAFVILDGVMDKRPIFFPFLVSILHDITGYRPGNVFVLNGILTFVFQGLVCVAGRWLAGRRAGWLGVALFAGLPLLAQNATGGGFELLNLVMILATLLLGARFAARRDEASFTAFCFSGLLLTQVRYESAVFLLPLVALALWIWWREGRVILSWPVILAPLLLVHCPLQNRIFDVHSSAWQLQSKPGLLHPFSLTYASGNLVHAMGFFFGKPTDQPNSLVLSILGVIAIPFLLLQVGRRVRNLAAESPISVATVFFTAGFAAQFALMMCYFWGQFDDPIIRRLSLPTQLWMVIAILAILPQFPRPAVIRTLLGVAVFGALCCGIPSMAAHAYDQEYLPGLATAWRRKFMADHPAKDYLMIDNDSILWIAHKISATTVSEAKKRIDSVEWLMRNQAFSAVYVFQQFNIDPETGRMTLRDKDDDLGPKFVLEPVCEQRLLTLTLSRISRVTELREGAAVRGLPDPGLHAVPEDHAKIEKMRQAYLENFLKQLP